MRLRRAVATIGLAQMVGYAGSFYMPAPLAAEMGPAVGASPAFVFMLFSAALLIGAFADLGLAASPRLAVLGLGVCALAAFAILSMLRRPRRG